MGVPSQLSCRRFPATTTRHSAHLLLRVALKGIRLDLKWKAAAQNISTVTEKSGLSGNVSEMPHLSQEEAAEQAGHTSYVWNLHWEGGEIAVSIENRSNWAATQEVKSNVEAFFFF